MIIAVTTAATPAIATAGMATTATVTIATTGIARLRIATGALIVARPTTGRQCHRPNGAIRRAQ
jgi:hypothetical protein